MLNEIMSFSLQFRIYNKDVCQDGYLTSNLQDQPQMIENTVHTKTENPSVWVIRFASQVRRHGKVLDLACGSGRNGRWFLKTGHRVTFLDQDVSALADLKNNPQADVICSNLETGIPFPIEGQPFDGVLVTNYLQRDILGDICDAVNIGGLLLYETFGAGNESYGRPRNPNFLLKPGELIATVRAEFNILGYEHGLRRLPSPAIIQRVAAIKC